MNTKKGKKPLSTRKSNSVSYDKIFGNVLSIPEAVQKVMEEQGLEGRFIDRVQYSDQSNFHRRGWKAFKYNEYVNIEGKSLLDGIGPDGVVRRGSLILAVRPIEVGNQHRQLLKNRAGRQSGQQQGQAELERMASAIGSKVTTGYGED